MSPVGAAHVRQYGSLRTRPDCHMCMASSYKETCGVATQQGCGMGIQGQQLLQDSNCKAFIHLQGRNAQPSSVCWS